MPAGQLIGKVISIAFVAGLSLGWTIVLKNASAPPPVVWSMFILAAALTIAALIEVWRS